MSLTFSYNFVAVDKFSKVANSIKDATSKINNSLNKVNSTATRVSNSLNRFSQSTKNFGNRMKSIGSNLALKVTAPISLLGVGAIKAAADLETLETSFVGILGSVDKAKNLVADLNEFTAKTPFQLEQVAKSAKQLVAAGIGPSKVKDQLQILGDISAAANIPLTDMAQIFAKIKNKGKAMTEEILQLSDRGIPIIDVLSKQLGVSKNAVFDMASKSKISVDIINKAFAKMTSKGGFANKAMILQSATLNGVISTLKDNILLTSAKIGDVMLPTVKSIASKIIELTAKLRDWIKENPKVLKLVVIIGLIVAAIGPLLIGLGFLVKIFGMVAAGAAIVFKGVAFLSTVFLTLGKIAGIVGTFLAGISLPMWGIIAAISALSVGIYFLIKNWQSVVDFIQNILSVSLNFLSDKIDYIAEKWKGLVSIIKDNPISKSISSAFEKTKGFVGNIIDKTKAVLGGTTENTTVNNINAEKPLNEGMKNSFEGNLSIDINDKNQNVKAARLVKKGDLNVGLNGVGL